MRIEAAAGSVSRRGLVSLPSRSAQPRSEQAGVNTSDFGANVFDENQQPRAEASEDAAASGARPKKRGARRKKGAEPGHPEPAHAEGTDAGPSGAGHSDRVDSNAVDSDADPGYARPETRRDAPAPAADFDAAPPAFREELPPPPLRSASANPWAEPVFDAEPSSPPADEAPARDGANPRRRRRRGRGERELEPTSETGPANESSPPAPREADEPAVAASELDREPRAPVFGRATEDDADGEESADPAADDESGERGAESERGSDADGGARRRRRRRRRGRRGDRDDRAVAGEAARPAAPFGGEPLTEEDGPASEGVDEDGEREAEPRERVDAETDSDAALDAELDAVDARSRGVEGERPEFRESERRERGGRERFESRDRRERDRDRDREVRRERPPAQPRIARPPIHVPTHESETRGARLAILIDLAHVEAQARALDREIAWGRLVVWLGKRRHVVRCIAYASGDSASRVRSTLLGNGIDVNVVADARLIPVAIAVDAMNLAARVDAVVLVPGSDELEPMTRALAGHGVRVESADFTPEGLAAETRTQPHHQLGAECLFAP